LLAFTSGCLLFAASLPFLGCRVTDAPIWTEPNTKSTAVCDIQELRDLQYASALKLQPFRHKLDLVLPVGKKDYPVVILVHGGAWILGDNRCCGLYTSVGQFLAGQGIGVVLPNYRLSPMVKHPDHVKDLAKVMAWTRDNIGQFGADPKRVFLLGHSAGGHLVSLLTTDEEFLQAEGMKTADIKGVISVSGVYRIPQGIMEFTFGGTGPLAFRADQMIPIKGDSKLDAASAPFGPIPGKLNVFGPMFGNDAQERQNASPLNYVRPGLPPFLIMVAEHDLPSLPGMADEFHDALVRSGCDAKLMRFERRNHNSLMFTATRLEDPAAAAMLDFIQAHDKR
jgi:acetyl esterase/lipase